MLVSYIQPWLLLSSVPWLSPQICPGSPGSALGSVLGLVRLPVKSRLFPSLFTTPSCFHLSIHPSGGHVMRASPPVFLITQHVLYLTRFLILAWGRKGRHLSLLRLHLIPSQPALIPHLESLPVH